MIEKITVVDQIEIIENAFIQVRQANKIVEDGVELASNYHRISFGPGDDISSMPDNVQAIAAIIWIPEVVAEYQAKKQTYNPSEPI